MKLKRVKGGTLYPLVLRFDFVLAGTVGIQADILEVDVIKIIAAARAFEQRTFDFADAIDDAIQILDDEHHGNANENQSGQKTEYFHETASYVYFIVVLTF